MRCLRPSLRPVLRTGLPSSVSTLLALLALALPVAAAPCGDDVDGRDVPCACGDVVVSDVVLGDDPVTRVACRGDGLRLQTPPGGSGLRVDLAGAHLRGGSRGIGLRVLAGGAGGVRILSSGAPAVVEGFRDGLVSQASRHGVAEVVGLRLERPTRDGVRIFGDGLLLRDVSVAGAGRDGIFVRGDGWVVEDVDVRQNGRHGLAVMGTGNAVRAAQAGASVRAEANGGDGVRVWGDTNLLFDCVAAGNRGSGVALNGVRLDVRRCEALANADGGVRGSASQSRFFGNLAFDNVEAGIGVHGHAVFDAGANVAAGSIAAPYECRLGLEACR